MCLKLQHISDEVCGQVYFKTLFITFLSTIYHLIINPCSGMQVYFCLPDNFPEAWSAGRDFFLCNLGYPLSHFVTGRNAFRVRHLSGLHTSGARYCGADGGGVTCHFSPLRSLNYTLCHAECGHRLEEVISATLKLPSYSLS